MPSSTPPAREPEGALRAAERRRINFSWLLKLRWGAVVGQVGTVLAVERLMGIPLPLASLFAIVGVELGTNLAAAAWVRRRRDVPEWVAPSVMGLDVLLLTGLLYLTGGAFNPFSFLYLVQIALAAVILPARWTWLLAALSLAGSAVLFVDPMSLPLPAADHAQHMVIHLRGMWVAFFVAAVFIVYFLRRVTGALAAREAELEAARERTTRNERLASLATLAAGAAHELSTPLSTIALAARELERRLTQPSQHARDAVPPPLSANEIDDIRLIREQVQRCRQILDRMAADAGASAGEDFRPTAVADLIAASVTELKTGAGAPRVVVEIPSDLAPRRYAMPPRALAQALRGLLKNAQDASLAPGSDVVIRAVADERWLRLEVRDTGPGMTPEVLARAGEPFFTTKEPGRGMGLGLFLTRAVVERIGGELQLRSTPGVGTVAVIALPAAAPPLAAPVSATAATIGRIAGTD